MSIAKGIDNKARSMLRARPAHPVLTQGCVLGDYAAEYAKQPGHRVRTREPASHRWREWLGYASAAGLVNGMQ